MGYGEAHLTNAIRETTIMGVKRDAIIKTAAMLVIGDEILSGRTQDVNVSHVAKTLTLIGIDLLEARIVADNAQAIVSAVRELSKLYDYVFTSGGIGPTHDDITADAIAQAFNVEIDHDPRAIALLEAHYANSNLELNSARLRMARIPIGAELIPNPVSSAPGFQLHNVYVMAGVPRIFQAMMSEVLPTLESGDRIESRTIDAGLPEGQIANQLGEIQLQHAGTMIGSYPYVDGTNISTRIVIRSRDITALSQAVVDVEQMITELNIKIPIQGCENHD